MGFRDLDFNLDLTGFNEDERAAFLGGEMPSLGSPMKMRFPMFRKRLRQ